MILIVASSKDIASLNIKKRILDHYDFSKTSESFQGKSIQVARVNDRTIKLVTLRIESTYAQNITDFFPKAALILFISRHSSASGTPTLSTHTPGNLGEAELGGISRKVSISPANTMRDVLKTMKYQKQELQLDYDVSYECTHHGPSLNTPTLFAELGSSTKQWNDKKAAEAVAHAAMEAISKFGTFPVKAALGVGGPHYNRKFTKMALDDEFAFGHIIPKYAIPAISEVILEECIERTLEGAELAVLDWKGIKSEYKPELVEMLEHIGIPYMKVK